MINTKNNKNKLIINVIFFLIVLLPLTLVSGPFLSDLSISIISILFLYFSYINKISYYYNNIYSKLFGIFFTFTINFFFH